LNRYLNVDLEDKTYENHPRGENLSNINKGYNKLRKYSDLILEYNENIESENLENTSEKEISRIQSSRRSTRRKSGKEKITKNNYIINNNPYDKICGKRNSTVKDLCNNNNDKLGNFLESELISQINLLKEEINISKTDKENLIKGNKINLEKLEEKRKEIEILNEKLKYMKEVVKKTENDIYQTKKNNSSNYTSLSSMTNNNNININDNIIRKKSEEFNSLKQENLDLFTENEILKVKVEELQKLNADLNNINQNINTQMNNYKQKYTLEITDLLQKLNDLEKEKLNLELKINELNNNNPTINNFSTLNGKEISSVLYYSTNSNREYINLNSSLNNSCIEKEFNQGGSKGKSILTNMKNEIKILQKKNQDEKLTFENTINLINIELKKKEENILELKEIIKKLEIEKYGLSNKFDNIEKDYFININQTKDFKISGENGVLLADKIRDLNLIKNDLENKLLSCSQNYKIIKTQNENLNQVIERQRKMELALKKEFQLKEEEMTKRTEIINILQSELTSLNVENLTLKKENFTLKSKSELSETELISKYDYDLNSKKHEIYILNEKVSNFEKNLEKIKEKLNKKENIIKLKKIANVTLVEIIKSKRNEVKCLEAMQYMNSAGMKENIKKIRDSENELLNQ